MKRLVLDIEDVFALIGDDARPDISAALRAKLDSYRKDGFEVVLTGSVAHGDWPGQDGSVQMTELELLAGRVRQLEQCGFAVDGLVLTNPRAMPSDLIVDDKAVTVEEFVSTNREGIERMLSKEEREA